MAQKALIQQRIEDLIDDTAKSIAQLTEAIRLAEIEQIKMESARSALTNKLGELKSLLANPPKED